FTLFPYTTLFRSLPRHGLAVLVSDCPTLPRSAPLVVLAPVAGPTPRRFVEYCPVGSPNLLRPRAVPLLRGGAAPGRPLRCGRPVGGGRPHVGARGCRLPAASIRDRDPAAARRGIMYQ